ncbi:MAG TPA: SDR family oxidoreductase [Gemmatimonadaceae bacterium]|jgi:NADP-dependent 3-hydroxy acid dehydrogenase YdfG|nr:SDR family oxidoreductase [Gemmatimonadaceae bacterium]
MAASLAGQSAIITGASRGIGAEIARRLTKEGVRVAVASRNRESLDRVVVSLGTSAFALQVDVTDRESVAAMGSAFRKTVGGAPDIVVNNAGLFRVAQIEAMKPEDFTGTVGTNLFGSFFILHEFLGEMKKRGSGHVLTIGSMGDRQIFPENAAYNSAKFGLRALHEVLRAEIRGTGVRATLLSPGSVDTALWDQIDTESEESGFPSRSEMLTPDAVGRAALFALTQPPSVNIDELRLSRA